jgi:hypothetical protein
MRIRDVLNYINDDPRIVVVQSRPYWLPEGFGWLLKTPVLREVLTLNIAIRVERVAR